MAIQEWRTGTFVTAAELSTLSYLGDKAFETLQWDRNPQASPYVWGFRELLSKIQKDLIDERRGGS